MAENVYGAAFVKSLEKNMFTDRDFANMLTLSKKDIENIMSEHGYEGETLRDMLENEENKTRKICAELCNSKEILDVMLAKDTFHNIKTALKCGLLGIGGKDLFKIPTEVDFEGIMLATKTGDFKKVQGEFSEFAKYAYKEYKKSGSMGEIDRCLDKLMVEYILKKSTISEFVMGWAQMYAEFVEVREEYFSKEADHEKTLPVIFKKQEDTLTEHLKGAHFSFFNDDAVFAYFFGKKTEVKNLRLIIAGAKERLRKAYV